MEKYLDETSDLFLCMERQSFMNHFPKVAESVLKIPCSSRKEIVQRENLCNKLKAFNAYSKCQNFIPIFVNDALTSGDDVL